MTDNTKTLLKNALFLELKEKPLDKITIVKLSKCCHINRQTFYYHFDNIYDLVKWVYKSEFKEAIRDYTTATTWQYGFINAMYFLYNNKNFVLKTYHSSQQIALENLLFKTSYHFIEGVLSDFPESKKLLPQEKDFIICFYKHALIGIILKWIREDLSKTPEEIMDLLLVIVEGQIQTSIHKFNQLKH